MLLKDRVLPIFAAIVIAALLLVGLIVIVNSVSTAPIRLASAAIIGPGVF